MALTEHQKLHLKAIVKDSTEEKNDKAVKSAQKILNSGKYPEDLDPDDPADLHDFLEKDSEGNKWQTL